MKKFISLLMCLSLLFIPLTAFAADSPAEPFIKMGDVNSDGKVNAADARLILRKSAGLTAFTYGFDGDGIPNSVKALSSDHFLFDITIDGMGFKIVRSGENIQIISPDISADMAVLGMTNCGIMLCDGSIYMTYTSNGMDVAMFIPESLYDDLGMTAEDINILASDITSMLPENIGTPEKAEENGATVYKYTVDGNVITVDEYGILTSIESLDASGNVIESVTVNEISAEVSADFFSLDRFELI